MNYRQLQYAVALSQVRNFSQVAEQLNISQPALSKQILALEQDLGVRLFDRSTTPLSLTPAGEHFLSEARELISLEDRLRRDMEYFRTGERGRLTIGVSPFRCLYYMPSIVKALRDRFPGLQVILREGNSEQLHKYALEGQVDLSITTLPVDDTLLDIRHLEPEKILLAVPKSMLALLAKTPASCEDGYPTVDLADCEKLPFVVLGQNQILRNLFEKLCSKANIHPQIVVEAVGIATAWSMAQAGVGATILPIQFTQGLQVGQDTVLFSVKNSGTPRQPVIITRKGQLLSQYAQCAIELLSK